jgi:hypothetical protein
MKTNHSAFIFVFAVIRLFALCMVVVAIYEVVPQVLLSPPGFRWRMLDSFDNRMALFRAPASLALWFMARPITKLVLWGVDSGYDGAPE